VPSVVSLPRRPTSLYLLSFFNVGVGLGVAVRSDVFFLETASLTTGEVSYLKRYSKRGDVASL